MTRSLHTDLSRIKKIAETLRALRGWKRFWAAFVFGSLTALAYAPLNIFPVFWLSFPALIFLLQGTTSARQAFITGWSFAFGGFFFGLYWIANSMFVDIARFWWAVPLSLAGLPLFFGIYYGLAMIAARKIGLRGLPGGLVFSLLWFIADYVRGHVFTGFPWNLEGYTWTRIVPMLQITSVTGIYGLTLFTILAAALPACLAEDNRRHRVAATSGIVFLVLLFAGGEIRLMHATYDVVPDVRLRLVQPNIDQASKWELSELGDHFHQLLALSSEASDKPVTHIIWPETAATFYLAEDEIHRRMVGQYAPANGTIITGVIRRNLINGKVHYYNSLIAVDHHARIIAGYDKVHLVPFGEYIPMRSILPLRTLANLGLDFTGGEGFRSLKVQGLPDFSPLVCYEAIFPGEVTDPDDRPQFLINVTNDGWYGHTTGPYQHFANVKVRAVEEGLPLVRAANTGISGVIDSYGRMTARLGVGRTGFVDADLPRPLPPTVFSRYREIPLWTIIVALIVAVIQLRRTTRTP